MARREPDSELLSLENHDLEPHNKSLTPPTSYPDSDQPASLLDRAVVYTNDHLQAFRRVPWVLATIGAFLVVRYSGMFRRFRCVSDIPDHLISQNCQVIGEVTTTDQDFVGVWHIPIGRRLLRWGLHPPEICLSKELLKVEFAGVAIATGKAAARWLETKLLGRRVWLTVLHRAGDPPALQCVVHARRGCLLRRSYCVNEALVSAGLGCLGEAPGFRRREDYAKLMHILGRAEQAAIRRGSGIWQGGPQEVWWRRAARRMHTGKTY